MEPAQNPDTTQTPQQFLLHGEPVCILTGNEFLKVEGKTFVQQVDDYFKKQGGIANSVFANVVLDRKGIKNDFYHGIGKEKRASFAAIKNVLENGIMILSLGYYHTNNKKQLTGMGAASIRIGEEQYICIVEVIGNKATNRLYVHEVFLTKNLLEVVATSPVHSSDNTTSRQPQGEVAKVLQNFLFQRDDEK